MVHVSLTAFIIIAILSIALSINNDPSVHLYLQDGSQVKLGRGIDINDIPIIECTNSQEKCAFNCTIHIRSKNDVCQLTLSSDDDTATAEVNFLYQFSENKVVVVWQLLREDHEFTKKITTIAMDNCTNMSTLTFSKRDLEAIVLYEDSFDAIVVVKSKALIEEGIRTRISYDLNGNQIEMLPLFSDSTQYGRDDKQLKEVLTYHNGEFEEQEIICTESGEYSNICGQQSKNVSERFICVQMDTNQNVYRQEFSLTENSRIIGVRNFKDGGMMSFGLESDSKLTVVEMRFRRRPKVRSVKLRWTVNKNESVVVDFRENKNDTHFTLISETDEFDHSVVMQFFKLVDKSRWSHRKRS